MKIAAISSSRVPSTTANSIQLMKVCQALQKVNGEVCLWVPGSASTSPEALEKHYGLRTPLNVRWLPGQRIFKRYDVAWEAYNQAVDWGADLIYTWMVQVAVLALMRGKPVILEMHDLPTGHIGPLLFSRFAHHPGRKRLLVITHALRWALERDYRFSFRSSDLQIAPNGVDLEQYASLPPRDEARRKLDLPEGKLAMYTGHFYAGRGMELLYGLARRFPGVNFLWVGGRNEDIDAWKKRIAGDGVGNIILTGFVDNCCLPTYQAAADILLMPYEKAIAGSSGGNSASICSPMKMFDYLAAGRPILASDLPVFHEVLNTLNSRFAPPENLEAWEKALADLLADEDLQRSLSAQAHLDAQNYSWQARARRALEGFISG